MKSRAASFRGVADGRAKPGDEGLHDQRGISPVVVDLLRPAGVVELDLSDLQRAQAPAPGARFPDGLAAFRASPDPPGRP
jgi:hypothetical protein